MGRPFKSELVIDELINEPELKGYHVGFDQNKFRLQPLVDIIRRVIPEFSLGYINGNIPSTEIVERLKEAAGIVYTTDKYQKRGEFGELILHLLLRDFRNSIPLISKISFKDTPNTVVHGFDGIHVTTDGENKLWLGESKLYKSGEEGIKSLTKDLENHVTANYLQQEFLLVSRKIPEDFPDRDYWLNLMDKHQKLDRIFSSIVIPMVCTYSSTLFKNFTEDCDDYVEAFKKECQNLKMKFDEKKITTNIEIVLLLLPVPDKDELNMELDKRLKAMQSI